MDEDLEQVVYKDLKDFPNEKRNKKQNFRHLANNKRLCLRADI